MNFEIRKSFDKDTSKIKDKELLQSIHDTILNIKKAQKSRDIKNIKKMQVYKNFYRIKIGHYRMGLRIENRKPSLALSDFCTEKKYINIFFKKFMILCCSDSL